MKSAIIFLITFAILFIVVYNWVRGIDYMQKNHPDYKGEDFLGEDVDTK
jgi:hypothetical protein